LGNPVRPAPRSASVTELRRKLHWLPIRQRITDKMATTYHRQDGGHPIQDTFYWHSGLPVKPYP